MFTEEYLESMAELKIADKLVYDCCLKAIQKPASLFTFFQYYTYFNGYAGSLVGMLAANIGLSRELFLDKNEKDLGISDRANEIAFFVHNATIDEHGVGSKLPHRTLAQGTLKAIGDVCSIGLDERNALSKPPKWLAELCNDFIEAYSGTRNDHNKIIEAIGFHIGSELFADHEYATIDEILTLNKEGKLFLPNIKEKLEPVNISNKRVEPYIWITIHAAHDEKGVEHEHFEDSLKALILADKYSNKLTVENRELALSGFNQFKDIHRRLFEGILGEL